MNHETARALVEAQGAATDTEREALAQHLAECPDCRAFALREARLREALAGERVLRPSARLQAALLAVPSRERRMRALVPLMVPLAALVCGLGSFLLWRALPDRGPGPVALATVLAPRGGPPAAPPHGSAAPAARTATPPADATRPTAGAVSRGPRATAAPGRSTPGGGTPVAFGPSLTPPPPGAPDRRARRTPTSPPGVSPTAPSPPSDTPTPLADRSLEPGPTPTPTESTGEVGPVVPSPTPTAAPPSLMPTVLPTLTPAPRAGTPTSPPRTPPPAVTNTAAPPTAPAAPTMAPSATAAPAGTPTQPPAPSPTFTATITPTLTTTPTPVFVGSGAAGPSDPLSASLCSAPFPHRGQGTAHGTTAPLPCPLWGPAGAQRAWGGRPA